MPVFHLSRYNACMRFLNGLKRVATTWLDADTSLYGAAAAYYAIFAVAPILVLTFSVVGFFLDYGTVSDAVLSTIARNFGADTAVLVDGQLEAVRPGPGNVIGAVVGLFATLLAATAIFTTLESALDHVFDPKPKDAPASGIRAALSKRLAAFGIMIGMSAVVFGSFMANLFISAAEETLGMIAAGTATLAYLAEFGVSFVAIAIFLALMLKFLPTRNIALIPALKGGLVGSVLFSVGRYLAGMYLESTSAGSTFGAASSLVILILWAFYLAQVFLLSAVVTKVFFLPKD